MFLYFLEFRDIFRDVCVNVEKASKSLGSNDTKQSAHLNIWQQKSTLNIPIRDNIEKLKEILTLPRMSVWFSKC